MNAAVEVNASSGSNPTDLELGKIQRRAEKPTAPDYDGDAGGTVVVLLNPNSRKIKPKKKKRKSGGEKDDQHAKAESIAGPSPDGIESINDTQKKPSSKKKKKSSSEAKFEDKKEDGSHGNQVPSKSPVSPKRKNKKSKRLSSNNEVQVKISSKGKLSEDIQATAKSGTKKLNPEQESAQGGTTENDDVSPGIRYVAARAPRGKHRVTKPTAKISSLVQEGTTQSDDVSPGIRYVDTRAPKGKRRVTKPTAHISSLPAASEPISTSKLNMPAEDGTPKTRTERSSKQVPEDYDCAVDDNMAPSGIQELSSPFPKRNRKVERARNKVQTPRPDRKPKDKAIIDEEKLEKKFRDMGLGLESPDDNNNEAKDENIEGANESRQAEEQHKRYIRHKRRAAARMEKVKNQKTGSSSKGIQPERDEEIGNIDSVQMETNANVTNMPKVNQQEVHIPVATLVEPPSKFSIWCKIGVGMCCFLVAICIIVGVAVGVSGTEDNINQVSSALTNPPTAFPPETSEPIPAPSPSPRVPDSPEPSRSPAPSPSPSVPESSDPSHSPSPAPSTSPSANPSASPSANPNAIKYGAAYWIQNNRVDNRWLSGSRSSDSTQTHTVSFSLSWPFTHEQWENKPNRFVFSLNFRDEGDKTSTYIWQFRSEFGDGTWMTEQNNDPKSGSCVKYEDQVILQNHAGINNKWLTGHRGDAGRWVHTANLFDGNYEEYTGSSGSYKFYVKSTPTGSSDPKVGECVEVGDVVYLNHNSRLYWLSGSRSDPYDSQDTSTNYVWALQHSEEDPQFDPSYQWIIRPTPGDGSRN